MLTLHKTLQHCIRRMASLQRTWCHDVLVAAADSDLSGTHMLLNIVADIYKW